MCLLFICLFYNSNLNLKNATNGWHIIPVLYSQKKNDVFVKMDPKILKINTMLHIVSRSSLPEKYKKAQFIRGTIYGILRYFLNTFH
jgi:hypothetical protein